MSSAEDRVRAAMSAAEQLAAREIPAAPPLRLPAGQPPGGRRRHAPRRWARWAVPLTAAAAVTALALSLAAVKGTPGETVAPVKSAPASASPAVPAGPGGVPRYYVAADGSNQIVAGDSVTGKLLGKLTLPAPHSSITFIRGITAAGDDRTFAVLVITYPAGSTFHGGGDLNRETGTARWYGVQLAPGTASPVRLTSLPLRQQAVHSSFALNALATALSGSGQELATTTATASGGLAVQAFSVATGQLLHQWATSDPSLSAPKGDTQGLATQPILTWIDGDRELALETYSRGPAAGSQGTSPTDTIRELHVSGATSGDLLTGSKVTWTEQAGQNPQGLVPACTRGIGQEGHFISADGSTLGCQSVTGPGTNPDLSFVTIPLAAPARARVGYQVTNMAQKGVSTDQALWISPAGNAIVGAWTTYAKGTLEDSPNGLHIGVISNGKYTPLRFPPGFDQEATVNTITW